MVTISIDLQEGFEDDTLVLYVNNQEMYRKEAVTTRLILGIADSIQFEIPQGQMILEVVLPKRKLSWKQELSASEPVFIGIAIRESRLIPRISATPFTYL